jgi:ketose-bisphosphate aldolase
MEPVPASQMVNRACAEGYAVPGFCVWSSDTINVVLRVASDCRAPVIIMHGSWMFPLLSPDKFGPVARALIGTYSVPAAIHLDHGVSMEEALACIEAGYTSVMLDYSTRPLAENTSALRQLVQLARRKGVTVEAELGTIGSASLTPEERAGTSRMTDPQQAATFVQTTGVDLLAVSIGNAHGLYTTAPRFDLDRLAAIRKAAGIPLVLHGGSGTPEDMLREAIGRGIAKVNVASELVHASQQAVEADRAAGKPWWPPIATVRSIEAIAPVVERWIRLTGAAGKA